MPNQRDFLLQHCELDWLDTNSEDEVTDSVLEEDDSLNDQEEPWDEIKQRAWEEAWK